MSVVTADFIVGSHGLPPQVGQAYDVPIVWSQGEGNDTTTCNLHMTRIQNLVFMESGPIAGPAAAGGAIIITLEAVEAEPGVPAVAASLLPLAFRPSVERNIPICVGTGAGPITYSMGNLKILPTGAMEVGSDLNPVTSTEFTDAPCVFYPRGAYSITGIPLSQD